MTKREKFWPKDQWCPYDLTEIEKQKYAEMSSICQRDTTALSEWLRTLEFLDGDFSAGMETWAWEVNNVKWRMDTGRKISEVFTNIIRIVKPMDYGFIGKQHIWPH